MYRSRPLSGKRVCDGGVQLRRRNVVLRLANRERGKLYVAV